jgi:hypothetical protein
VNKDEQARARLVEIALRDIDVYDAASDTSRARWREAQRRRAGFRDPSKGSWCVAGLTAAMEDAGLLVPDPGTLARQQSIALLDFVYDHAPEMKGYRGGAEFVLTALDVLPARPGDLIAWLQHPIPDGMRHSPVVYKEAAGWRCGYVAVIVSVDDESIATVGWGEGPKPGRVMKRRLWRDPERKCEGCAGVACWTDPKDGLVKPCPTCKGTGRPPRSSTVLWRRPGGLYGIARPVAR